MKYKAIIPYHSYIVIEVDNDITGSSKEEMEEYVNDEINHMTATDFEEEILMNLIDCGNIDFIKVEEK